MKLRLIFSLLIGSVGALVAQPKGVVASPPAVQLQGYTREVAFTQPMGRQSQNIGFYWDADAPDGEGVHGLSVVKSRVYMGDGINGAVKVFSLNGRFLCRTQGTLDLLRTIAVNSQGEIFALSGSSCNILSKFSPSGKLLWWVRQGEALRGTKDHFDPLLSVAPDGGVAVPVSKYTDTADEIRLRRLAVFDRNGKLLRVITASFADDKGRAYAFGFLSPPYQDAVVLPRDLFGRDLGEQKLLATPRVKTLFEGTLKGTYTGLGSVHRSSGGIFYSLSQILLPTRVEVRPTPKGRTLDSGLYAVVIAYGPSGQSIAAARFLCPPFSDFDRSITMDEHNNIYTVEYVPSKVRVVRYKWKSTAKQ